MAESMDIDQNGVSGQATPAESVTESSFHRDHTPESTEVPRTFLVSVNELLMCRMVRYMYNAFLFVRMSADR